MFRVNCSLYWRTFDSDSYPVHEPNEWKNEAFSVANGTIKNANMSLHIGQWIRYVQLNINLLPLTCYHRNTGMERFRLSLFLLWLVFVCWKFHKTVWRIVFENAWAYVPGLWWCLYLQKRNIIDKLSTVISACLRCTTHKKIRSEKIQWDQKFEWSHSSVAVVLFHRALLFYCAIMQCPYRLFPFRFSFLSFIYANNDTMDGTRWISELCFSSLNWAKALSCFWPRQPTVNIPTVTLSKRTISCQHTFHFSAQQSRHQLQWCTSIFHVFFFVYHHRRQSVYCFIIKLLQFFDATCHLTCDLILLFEQKTLRKSV